MKLKNIGDLLRECPEGTKLYSPIFGVVSLENVNTDGWIKVIPKRTGILQLFYPDGRFSEDGEVMLFPSDTNRNWDNFVIPFKDGDILATELGSVFILNTDRNDDVHYGCYVGVACNNDYLDVNDAFAYKHLCKYATEEEKAKLFQAIKENGYKWNAETKTLEKLPKFKVGDKVRYKNDKTVITITGIKDDYYFIQFYNVGKCDYQNEKISFKDQDKYELVPNKFDINTLIPFESRVLVRNDEHQYWIPAFWGCKRADGYTTTFGWCKYCIPYDGNEHLLETNNDCDEYFKTWE